MPLLIRVQELTEEEAFRKALILNIQRENHTAEEFGDIIANVREAHYWIGASNTDKVAKYLCVSPATIIQYEKFMGLPADIKKLVSEERMALSAALETTATPEEKRGEVVGRAQELAREEKQKKVRKRVQAEKKTATSEQLREEGEAADKGSGDSESDSSTSTSTPTSTKKKSAAEPLRVPEPEWMKEDRRKKKEREKELDKAAAKAAKSLKKATEEKAEVEQKIEETKGSGKSQETRDRLAERLKEAEEKEAIAVELQSEVAREKETLEKEKAELQRQREEFAEEVRLQQEAAAEAAALTEPAPIEARHVRQAQREIPGALTKLKAPKFSDFLQLVEDKLDSDSFCPRMRELWETVSLFAHGKVAEQELIEVVQDLDKLVREGVEGQVFETRVLNSLATEEEAQADEGVAEEIGVGDAVEETGVESNVPAPTESDPSPNPLSESTPEPADPEPEAPAPTSKKRSSAKATTKSKAVAAKAKPKSKSKAPINPKVKPKKKK